MKGTLIEWLFLVILAIGSLATALIGNEDISLGFAAFSTIVYGIICRNSAISFNQNILLLFSLLLLLVLATYRIMFDLEAVQAYIANDMEMRNKVVSYGGSLVQLLMMGAYVGMLSTRKTTFHNTNAITRFFKPSFVFLMVVAWVPLVANFFLYLLFFRGRPYVDIHIYAHGPLGLILKTIYLTYGAIIIMAIGGYSKDRAFRAAKWIILGIFVLFGLLLQLRSPLLLAVLLFVYFFGQRVSSKMLIVWAMVSVLALAAIGVMRDPEAAQSDVSAGLITSLLGLGEFADALRFALERSEIGQPMWGWGIVGSFLGITEPLANTYAKMIAPDYFDEGGGFGFFFLADMVMNFGKMGALVVMFMLGFVLVRLYYSGGLIRTYVFLPILFGNLFGLVRNDIGSTFRGVIYALLAVVVIRYGWILIRSVTTSSSAGNEAG